VFTREAVAAVFRASGGLPRTVNVISDNALIGGFASQVKPINARFVEDVCRDFDIAGSVAPSPSFIDVDQVADKESPEPESQAPVSAPNVPEPTTGEAPALEQCVVPMFGQVGRKRPFSFF
jgi:hypothetical protein